MYLESELGFYPLDLLARVFLNLCLSGFGGFLCSFESFNIRAVFFRELCNLDVSLKDFAVARGSCYT